MSPKQKQPSNNPYKPNSLASKLWNEESTKPENPKKARRLAAALALSGLIGSGLLIAGKATEGSSPEARAQKLEHEVTKKIKNQELPVSDSIIVLNEGAKIRETPARFVRNPDSLQKDMDVSNVVFELPLDTHVVIKQGLEWTDEDNEEWIGFEFARPDEDKPRLRWVNKSALLAEATNDTTETSNRTMPPISVYGYDAPPNAITGYRATVNDNQEVVSIDAQYGQIANSTTVSDEQLYGLLEQVGAETQ